MGTEQDRLIGSTVGRFRVQAGLSQQAVAEGMRARNSEHRWSQATVWGVEKGDRALKAMEIYDLSRVLGCGVLYLVNPSDATSRMRELILHHNAMGHVLADIEDSLESLARERSELAARVEQFHLDERQILRGTDGYERLEIEVRVSEEAIARADMIAGALKRVIDEYEVDALSGLMVDIERRVDRG